MTTKNLSCKASSSQATPIFNPLKQNLLIWSRIRAFNGNTTTRMWILFWTFCIYDFIKNKRNTSKTQGFPIPCRQRTEDIFSRKKGNNSFYLIWCGCILAHPVIAPSCRKEFSTEIPRLGILTMAIIKNE